MADGVGYTAGSGVTISTDDAGAAGHVQIIKLAISTDGSATVIPADATYGLDVDVTRIASVTPGTAAAELGKAEDAAHSSGDTGVAILAVRTDTAAASSGTDGDYEVLHTDDTGNLRTTTVIRDSSDAAISFATAISISVTPTIDTSAYASGDNLDTTILSFANATASSGGSGWITKLVILDKDNETTTDYEVWLLNASITPPTENAAFSLSDTDAEKVVAVIDSSTGSWYSYTAGQVNVTPVGPPVPFTLASGTTLYAVVKVVGTPTFASASDLTFKLHILRD